MSTFLFLAAICLLVAASILLETDATPKTNTKLEKGPSSSGKAQSTPVLTVQNLWAARSDELTLSEPDGGLIVEGKKNGEYSVLAKQPIPKKNIGIFYYEVTIKGKGDGIFIGLATKEIPLGRWVGEKQGTYAYGSDGALWGHEVKGCSKWDERPYIEGQPEFKEGDVIGCGVNLATRQMFYTKNGQRLETADLSIADVDLFPSVSLYYPENKIEANFGTKEFKFDIAKAFRI